ncbi:CHAT domain-containing tetratricopeptide repeat protein [bacterium]|nr:CHAT domain-containing tetratricopeptide repeat protein [bacterium]
MASERSSSDSVDKTVSQIYTEVIRNPRKALKMSTKALSEARNPVARAKLTLARAHCLREIGHYTEAIREYTRAAKLFQKQKMTDESWRTSIGKMDALDQMGQYREALNLADRTAKYFRFSSKPFWEAKIFANTGNIYQHLGQYDQALKYYQKAYPILSNEQPGDGYILRFNQATSYLCSGNPENAVELLKTCQAYFEQENLSSFLARTHYNLAYGFYLKGKYHDALFHLNKARTQLIQLKDWSFLASCYLDEAEIYLRLNQIDEAITWSRKARKSFLKLGMPYELAESNAFIGIALMRQKRISTAVPFLQDARKFFERQGNQVKAAEMEIHIALAFWDRKKWALADSHLQNAYKRFRKAGIYSQMMTGITYLAELELSRGNVAKAKHWLNQASRWISRVQLPWILLPYYQTLGRTQFLSGGSGRKALNQAIKLTETMRGEIPAEDLRISYLEDKLAPYHMLINHDLQTNSTKSVERSFELTERARSRVLQDLLEGSLQFDDRLATELNAFRSESWRRNVSDSGGSPTSLEAEKRIVQLLRRAQRLNSAKDTKLLKVSEIKRQLHPEQSILSFYKIGDSLNAFVIDSSGITAFPNLARNSELISSWHFLRFQIDRGHSDPQNSLASCDSHLHALYKQLFAPLMEKLQNTNTITVIPHGWLHALPFHCLRDEQGYLADRFKFSYAPSVSVYAHCLQRFSTGGRAPLPAKTNRTNALIVGHSDAFAPWIDQEVDEIRKLFPMAKVFTGDSARSIALLENSPAADVIHISSHGRFLPAQPFHSGIKLSDGWFTSPQIYQLHLNSRLVTLSGCETGTSEVTAGDDLVGLTRGFLYAGASSLLVSLWRVFDASTATFMKHFYSHLSSGFSLSDAWHHAVLEIKREWPHPYHWAPFVLIGKPN